MEKIKKYGDIDNLLSKKMEEKFVFNIGKEKYLVWVYKKEKKWVASIFKYTGKNFNEGFTDFSSNTKKVLIEKIKKLLKNMGFKDKEEIKINSLDLEDKKEENTFIGTFLFQQGNIKPFLYFKEEGIEENYKAKQFGFDNEFTLYGVEDKNPKNKFPYFLIKKENKKKTKFKKVTGFYSNIYLYKTEKDYKENIRFVLKIEKELKVKIKFKRKETSRYPLIQEIKAI